MLQDMDNMEVRCMLYVNVDTFTHLQQSEMSVLSVNKPGIVWLTVQHDLNSTIGFM